MRNAVLFSHSQRSHIQDWLLEALPTQFVLGRDNLAEPIFLSVYNCFEFSFLFLRLVDSSSLKS